MSSLTKEQEQEVDAFLLADRILDAIRFYKQAANTPLKEAIHEIHSRRNDLSKKHPKVKPTVEAIVTAYNLCEVRGARAHDQMNEAVTIGTHLASYANTDFYLTDTTPDYSKIDDTKRWWDDTEFPL